MSIFIVAIFKQLLYRVSLDVHQQTIGQRKCGIDAQYSFTQDIKKNKIKSFEGKVYRTGELPFKQASKWKENPDSNTRITFSLMCKIQFLCVCVCVMNSACHEPTFMWDSLGVGRYQWGEKTRKDNGVNRNKSRGSVIWKHNDFVKWTYTTLKCKGTQNKYYVSFQGQFFTVSQIIL